MRLSPAADAAPRGREAAPGLRRALGPLDVTASGVGIIIGAGIYVLLGAATAEAGPAVWASFGLAAAQCALTGLSYAELASMYPRAAAEYEFTRHAFPERVAFVVGWTMALGLMVAAAAVALGFAHYVRFFVDVPLAPTAMGLLLLEGAFARTGIRSSARLTLLLSTVQVLGLLAVIAVGITHLGSVSLTAGSSVDGVLGGAALVFFAFIGFDEVITLAEETEHPTRVIPRALLSALAISTVLYMAVAVAAVSVVGARAIASSTTPLADVMADVVGGRAQSVVAAVALLTTINTSLLAMTAGSRIVYGMASTGALPQQVARVHPQTQAPTTAIGVVALAAVAVASLGDLSLIASVTDITVYVVFLAVNATVIVLRFREPERARPFRTPGVIGRVPVLPIAGLAGAGLMIPQLSLPALGLGAVVVLSGVIAFGPLRRRGEPS